ncbi:MAG: HAD-IA family hydrolase [Pirellulaceae bacterium]
MFRAVLFDFDYTLADSTEGAVECVNHALFACGLPLATREAIRRCIGYPPAETFARLTGIDGNDEALAGFLQAFMSRADEVMAPLTTLFPQTIATMQQLRQEGLRTGIVSTKFRFRIESILANHEAGRLFDLVVGGEDVERHKPHPDGLIRALTRLQLEPEQVLFVGDHPVDAQAAEAAGVPFVAMLSGASTEDDFGRLPRKGMLSRIDQLPKWLQLWQSFERFASPD